MTGAATGFDLPESWRVPLAGLLDSPALVGLQAFLQAAQAAGEPVLPPPAAWFQALQLTPPHEVRIVILGQDPYHGLGQAHGLSFSVPPGVKVPPSLRNIYKELAADLGFAPPRHGHLEAWARQGVLLLNTTLTVGPGKPGSHAGKGWEALTDEVVKLVSRQSKPSVFMLWGRHAQQKEGLVDVSRHLVLKAAHPSPLSAHNGFLGCRHFSRANAFLKASGRGQVNWELPAGG